MENVTVRPAYGEIEDEIDPYKLVQSLWRKKWIIAFITLMSIVGAVIYLNFATYTYTVTLKIVPVIDSGGTLSPKISGLAELAGITGIGTKGVTQFVLYKELFTSLGAAENVSRRTDLMRVVFAGEWNAEKKSWIEPASALRDLKDRIKSTLGIPIYPWQPPDGARLEEYLKNAIKTTEDRKTAIMSISIDTNKVSFGRDLLWALHESVDASLRDNALKKTTRNIDYLRQLLTRVAVAEHRRALIGVLSTQEKLLMMASSGLFFAAEPLGKPTAPLKPSKPEPKMVLVLSALVGLFVGILMVLTGNWIRNQGRENSAINAVAWETKPSDA